MPYVTDKVAINDPFIDRRSKLLPCQKQMMFYWHERGEGSRKIAKRFKVSKRTVQFILDPEKRVENLKRRAERGGHKQYYDTEKNNEYQQLHRSRKYKTLKDTIKKE